MLNRLVSYPPLTQLLTSWPLRLALNFRGSDEMPSPFELTFILLAKLAGADGRVSPKEIGQIEQFIKDELRLSTDRYVEALRILRHSIHSNINVDEIATQLYFAVRGNRLVLIGILSALVATAYSDGDYSTEEETFVSHLMNVLRFPESDIEWFHALQRSAFAHKVKQADDRESRQAHTGAAKSEPRVPPDCYRILACVESDSSDTIRRQYRKLAKLYHPDKVLRAGTPPEFVEAAESTFREIQNAYEEIKALRGIS